MYRKFYQALALSLMAFLVVYTIPKKDDAMAFMETAGYDDVYNFITGELPKVPGDAVSWQVFNKVKEIKISTVKDGIQDEYFKPEYTDEVKALDGKSIKIKGFIFPLSPEKKQNNFLIGPFALSCPFHYHVQPKFVIEVESTQKPIDFTYDMIIVEGVFEVKFNKETGVFYYLKNARLVKD